MLLFVDQLTNVDFSLLDPERGLLGETWLASVRLEGSLDHQGMVCDFGIVKKQVRQWLDHELDHRLAVPVRSPRIAIEQSGQMLDIRWRFGPNDETLYTRCPADALALVDSDELTPEKVAHWAVTQLRQRFPDSVQTLALTFTGETINGAQYQYSHGLKKHAGNCQRIAHGHRSRLLIERDGQRDTDLENDWARRWCDIYVGTREDLQATEQRDGVDYYHFAYQSAQGPFELTLPARCCYLIDNDSTVECIAQHIADTLAAEHPGHKLRVRAYEGLGKGAIAESRG